MKSLITFATVLILFTCQTASAQEIKLFRIFYRDTVTQRTTVRRPFTFIGETPYWSKPENLDFEITIDKRAVNTNGVLQIYVEELLQPSSTVKSATGNRWHFNRVLFSTSTKLATPSGVIKCSNIPYQTAYFISSLLYQKIAFRIVAFYFNKATNKTEQAVKTYYYE
ncbi:hypothetical protein DYU05_10040 [Mucilaginibacter terrenus]|uniref:Uncharacterized protein n=1 Tax=Mucilaginibacter terrenus TaxID=2482727 RepID=A0A3E2NYA2_9SPHI|nr:hypothetical protein [Mucilaginibacter terrenus]RFZ85901.1 hypothetical protein DYU05_10040 [Mucilaginibacter terrenus]